MLFSLGLLYDPAVIFCTILVAAILLDLWIGEPKWIPHPVVQMGKLISFLEKKWNKGKHRKGKGVGLTVTVLLTVFLLTISILYIVYQIHPVVCAILQIYLISSTIAVKGLSSAAKDVLSPLMDGNLIEARRMLSMIVGRDTENLSESEIVRGTVETVAENTVDGITAPLFWAMIGGAPLAMVYRAINTLDSMVGYKNDRYIEFGWASAKLDDIVNWVPARITAISIWLSSFVIKGSKKRNGWKVTWRDARKHPSPNSGWSESMIAGLLGIRLGGVNYYRGIKSKRAYLGDPLRELVRFDIKKTIIYMHGGWIVFLVIGLCILLLNR
ncbi:adenosylcobinamide-phosphate synthase CbiB [Ureibacillus acetophenoni]|uniref:Cobalamin biosynthesis protein CobD n=1 Tax=Ureibacillus acetophenoni TaxID=614649 RepID=A0A285UMC1_9BACL|nr:adenosylcobinamide-phosphate synthase CbiB [Ureibacillus acetophenoni]SOC43074.1 adenosylcobinamide-phosphate synthase [Ureibacillus acetophenoni]